MDLIFLLIVRLVLLLYPVSFEFHILTAIDSFCIYFIGKFLYGIRYIFYWYKLSCNLLAWVFKFGDIGILDPKLLINFTQYSLINYYHFIAYTVGISILSLSLCDNDSNKLVVNSIYYLMKCSVNLVDKEKETHPWS